MNRVIALGDLVVHGIFSQNFYWMITGYRSDLSVFTAHTWTLSIEFWLFLVWLVAFRFAKSDKARVFFNIISIVCAIAWRMVAVVWIQDVMITSLCPIAHMDAFALGSLMALYEKNKTKQNPWVFIGAGVLGIFIIFGSIFATACLNEIGFLQAYALYSTSKNYLNSLLTCNIYLGLSLFAIGLLWVSKQFEIKGKIVQSIIICGNVSYSAYLIHYPINVVLERVCQNEWLVFLVTTVVTLVCSIVIEKIIKEIQLRIKKR